MAQARGFAPDANHAMVASSFPPPRSASFADVRVSMDGQPATPGPETPSPRIDPGSLESPRKEEESFKVEEKEKPKELEPLPPAFTGAKNLIMPDCLPSKASGATLPSRLKMLGNKGFKILAALKPYDIGNAVIGYAPDWRSYFSHGQPGRFTLFLLPRIFSRSMARMCLFFRFLIALGIVIVIMSLADVEIRLGRAWAIGTLLAILVMLYMNTIRWSPDGVMAFCRSMGVPEVEEYMFSYSWKVQEDSIRTLAKAMWQAGVGVWIDVVKLNPGDEIRPVVRTMVKNVYRCVVFLSPEYVGSPNCCVEFWEAVQHPRKLILCILKPMEPAIMDYIDNLKAQGARVVNGMQELIPVLNAEVENTLDLEAFQWWRSMKIAGGGVPEHVAPLSSWPIPRFQLCGRVMLPRKSLTVGPLYVSGHLQEAGYCMRLPWLFLISAVALVINFVDLYLKVVYSAELHSSIDYIALAAIGICNISPFMALTKLFETRVFCHPALRPLVASKSINGGVKIKVNGDGSDPVYQTMRNFVSLLGHAPSLLPTASANTEATGLQLPSRRASRRGSGDRRKSIKETLDELCITVYVMSSIAHRDQLFGSEQFNFDMKRSVFVWTGNGDPFKGEAGQRMMRFLVLVADWEKENLAESLFSAIGVRVVDCLHGDEAS